MPRNILQPKHSKLKKNEIEALFEKLNISAKQVPKMKEGDPALPENVQVGDIIKIERKDEESTTIYYRVVVPAEKKPIPKKTK